MRTRVISSIIGIALFIPFIFLGGGYFAFCMWVLGIIGMTEFAQMQKLEYFSSLGVIFSLTVTSILLPTYYWPTFLQSIDGDYIFYFCCIILMILTVFRYRDFNIENVAVMILAAIYIGVGFRNLILLRDMGLDSLLYLFIVIWATDSGAYFIGKWFGKRKLAPIISPNKTVEGLLGGVLTSLVVGLLYAFIVKPKFVFSSDVWLLTITISLVGQFGDLVESAIKRHFNVKDSGVFLPGHGGLLDRFDSLIFASMTLMIWYNLFR